MHVHVCECEYVHVCVLWRDKVEKFSRTRFAGESLCSFWHQLLLVLTNYLESADLKIYIPQRLSNYVDGYVHVCIRKQTNQAFQCNSENNRTQQII